MNNNNKKNRLTFGLIIIFIFFCSYLLIYSSLPNTCKTCGSFEIPFLIFFLSLIVIITLAIYLVKAESSHKTLLEQVEMSTLVTVDSKLMMWELMVDSGVMTFSDSFFLLTGYDKQLFESSIISLKHRIHPDDLDNFNKLFRKTNDESNEANQVRCRLKKSNGDYIWIDAIAKANYTNKNRLHFTGIFLDVTHNVQKEQELETENQIVDKLIKLASIQAWTWNVKDSKFKFILNSNPSRQDIHTLEDFFKFILEEDVQRVSVAISDYINQKLPECYVQFRDKTGEQWYEFFAYTLSNDPETNKPFKFVGFQRDITERKRLNELYHESQKVETISRLAGGMAHDFNNILQVIHGFADLTMLELDEGTDALHSMQHMMQGVEKAKALVEQLLTFSRDDLNRPFPLIVNDSLNNFVNLISSNMEEKNIDFEFQNNIANSRIYADPKKLDQILSKLVDNAISAVSEVKSPKIKISTNQKVVETCRTKLGLNINPGKYIVISVEDNGCGIPSDIKPLIFDPFFTTKDIGEGRGLGLSTVYNCMKSHDGFIDVVSESEIKGTRFDVYFPEYILIDRKISPIVTGDFEKNSNSPVVLVVDDFQISINVIKKHLGTNFTVFESTSGVGALELFGELYESIDVVILDCIMENTNGMEIYKKMLEKKPELPVIFISGYTKNDVEKQFGKEIEEIFLLKPIQKEVLLTALNNLSTYEYKE